MTLPALMTLKWDTIKLSMQIVRLNEIFATMKNEELPKTRERFENWVMLYHILMDIQDLLTYKANFVSKMDQKQIERYWKRDGKDT